MPFRLYPRLKKMPVDILIFSLVCIQIYTGFLQDHLNADHAWLETVLMNIHENPDYTFPDQLLQVCDINITLHSIVSLLPLFYTRQFFSTN